MNWIVLRKEELDPTKTVRFSDHRHHHIKTILKKKQGDSVQVVLAEEGNYLFKILQITETETIATEEVTLEKTFDPISIHCFFSLPRPQTAKKIFHLAGAYGVKSLSFFATETKNKEYWTSPIFNKEWKEWIDTGLSQSGNYLLPDVHFGRYENWKEYLKSWKANVIVLDRMGINDFKNQNELNIKPKDDLFVFGSESGWKENDYHHFRENKYLTISLGKINLRTEFAFASLLYDLFKS